MSIQVEQPGGDGSIVDIGSVAFWQGKGQLHKLVAQELKVITSVV